MSQESLIAVFIDFENLALGVADSKAKSFDVDLVLKRLLQKGRVVFKRAYCDWSRYRKYVRTFHSEAIELVDIPQTKVSGKNSADIRMVVDALELCYVKEHIDIFALVTGDSDFSPLVSKLKENNRRVIGCGIKSSTSNLLINNCDEFIFYDDIASSAAAQKPSKPAASPEENKRMEAVGILVGIVQSLESDYDPVWGSLVKQTIRRVYPGFNETSYGFKNFAGLLQEAEQQGRLELAYDASRGNYKVHSKSR